MIIMIRKLGHLKILKIKTDFAFAYWMKQMLSEITLTHTHSQTQR